MNVRAISVVSYAVAIAVCFTTTACSEGDKYGKEVDRETILQVAQPPYDFSLSVKCRDEGDSTLQMRIQKEDTSVEDAQVSAKLVTPDGGEQAAKFVQEKEKHLYEASLPLKHHADYLVNSAISIEGKTFTPIFSFHSGDPALEKLNKKGESKSADGDK